MYIRPADKSGSGGGAHQRATDSSRSRLQCMWRRMIGEGEEERAEQKIETEKSRCESQREQDRMMELLRRVDGRLSREIRTGRTTNRKCQQTVHANAGWDCLGDHPGIDGLAVLPVCSACERKRHT